MKEVKKPRKSLAFYYVITLVVLLLFNLIAMPNISEGRIIEVDYGTFMSMTADGKIGRASCRERV